MRYTILALFLAACGANTVPCPDLSVVTDPSPSPSPTPMPDLSVPKTDMERAAVKDMSMPPSDLSTPKPCPDLSVSCEPCDKADCDLDEKSCQSDDERAKLKKCHKDEDDSRTYFHKACHTKTTICHC